MTQPKDRGKRKIDPQAAKRLLAYVTGRYKARFLLVLFCILIAAAANVAGSLFYKS